MIAGKGKTIRKITTRKLRALHRFAIAAGSCLVAVLILYVFVISPSVFHGKAAETLLCLRICAQGVSPCLPTVCANPPAVSTQAVSNIETTSAQGNGTVISDGGDAVTARGMALATTTAPTIDNSVFAASAGGTGTFTTTLTGLSAATTYYVRSYATNGFGTSYGGTLSFTTAASAAPAGSPSRRGGSSAPSGAATPVKGKEDPKPEKKLSDFLMPGHPVQDRAVTSMDEIRNIEGTEKVKHDGKGKPIVRFKRPVFSGKTNIKDAQILITLYSTPIYATTDADGNGNWTWVASQPLEDGEHSFLMLGFNPEDNSVASSASYTFIVVTEQEQAETPPAPTEASQPHPSGTSGGTIVTPEEPQAGFTHEYLVNVSVISEPEEINKTGNIDLKTEIISFNPEITEPVSLTYTIYNAAGTTVFTEQKNIFVTDAVTDHSRAVTSEPLEPGNYVVDVHMQYRNRSVGTSRVFEVKSYKVVDIPLVAVTQEQLSIGLQRLALALTALFLLSIVFLVRERKAVRRAQRLVNDADLFQSGMIA